MAYTKVTGPNFYVYALYREDWVTPFYIGKGCGGRWLVHEKEAFRRTCRKSRVIQAMWKAGWYEIPKQKLAEGLTDEEAKTLEIKLIAQIGRQPNGPLVNHTDGGDGVSKLSDESKAKKSAANVKSWADPVVRQKRINGMILAFAPTKKPAKAKRTKSEASKQIWEDQDYRDRQIANLTGRVQSEETKAKRGASVKKAFENEATRQKHGDAVRAALQSEEVKARQKEGLKDPVAKAKYIAAARTPEALIKRGRSLSANLNTPEGKAKRSAVMKANWARRKAAKAAEPLPLFDLDHQ